MRLAQAAPIAEDRRMDVAIPLFPKMTALDAVGPYEVLWRVPGVNVRFVGDAPGAIESDRPLRLCVDYAYADWKKPDIVLVPGGFHVDDMVADAPLVEWVKEAHETTTWTTSVCTGALVLGAADVLRGKWATTHWAARDSLASYGAQYLPQRVVVEGKVVTAAGVSSGIDMALTLAALIAGDDVAKAIQLDIEYDPQPPFDAGSLTKAAIDTIALARAVTLFDQGLGPWPPSRPDAPGAPGADPAGPAAPQRF
jgi:transcriptional regulator GlxA family with amidase domain